MSTTLCTGAVKNIASRYMLENSAVYACFLDASKAFDLVNHKLGDLCKLGVGCHWDPLFAGAV